MRREYEWVDYLNSIDEDRKQRALTGKGAMVTAREGGIMVQAPERQTTTIKKDVADKIPDAMPLACAEAILEYSPIDVVDKISPRGVLFIAVEGDAVTPEQQSFDLYEKAQEPKKLRLYKKTTHYGIYTDGFIPSSRNKKDPCRRRLPGPALPQSDLRRKAVLDRRSSRKGTFVGRRGSRLQGDARVGRVRRLRRALRAAWRPHRRIYRSDESDLDARPCLLQRRLHPI